MPSLLVRRITILMLYWMYNGSVDKGASEQHRFKGVRKKMEGKKQNKPGQGLGGRFGGLWVGVGAFSRTCIVMIYPIDGWTVLKVLLCRLGPSVATPGSQIWPGSRSKRSKVNCKRIFIFHGSVGFFAFPFGFVLFLKWDQLLSFSRGTSVHDFVQFEGRNIAALCLHFFWNL